MTLTPEVLAEGERIYRSMLESWRHGVPFTQQMLMDRFGHWATEYMPALLAASRERNDLRLALKAETDDRRRQVAGLQRQVDDLTERNKGLVWGWEKASAERIDAEQEAKELRAKLAAACDKAGEKAVRA